MLFSEPKIPQCNVAADAHFPSLMFQCSSASRKFLNIYKSIKITNLNEKFQCSSASRKFLNKKNESHLINDPQSFSALQRAENSSILEAAFRSAIAGGFSALQRAENSSIPRFVATQRLVIRFQCSSASRKFLNGAAEHERHRNLKRFQCSSASRKFLNRSGSPDRPFCLGFSALQRAENSSIASTVDVEELALGRFSALQRAENSSMVPQTLLLQRHSASFQCSSASRKFLNSKAPNRVYGQYRFQCSSASRKFLN